MTALASKRAVKVKSFTVMDLPHATEQVYQGGIACWDTTAALVAKGKASATLQPIGYYVEDKNVGAGESALVRLFQEVWAAWYANDGSIAAADLGGLCYLVDDQTVSDNDAANTLSVAGRIWAVDSAKGVLVEFRDTGAARAETGLDV